MRKILQQKVYHDGRSMIVLKPGDTHDVPDRLVQTWIDEGVIAGKTSKAVAAERAAQIKADEGTQSGDYSMKQIPGGRFTITGPDGFKETVHGKDAAEARLAELTTPDAAAADDEAPVA